MSMGFSRQGDWSGLPCPAPGDLPDPGSEPGSPVSLQAGSLQLSHLESPYCQVRYNKKESFCFPTRVLDIFNYVIICSISNTLNKGIYKEIDKGR